MLPSRRKTIWFRGEYNVDDDLRRLYGSHSRKRYWPGSIKDKLLYFFRLRLIELERLRAPSLESIIFDSADCCALDLDAKSEY